MTLNKQLVTLKQFHHIITFPHISYPLYIPQHFPKPNILINTKHPPKYTLHSHKHLQKHTQNLKINTPHIKNLTFKLLKTLNHIQQLSN
ncbi:exotoxin beta-grasp domain-containing protein [Staphylococcus aureus]|uniref:exotoxin beta-grasp domain-containing protein n=1 Tax=Staphylococcus aureus TaxID=1280 RepID=UPI0037D9FD16